MPSEGQASLDEFIASLAAEDVNVWSGPIFLQDGSEYVADGSVAADDQIWYLPQLLLGMIGPSE
jgi:simple sugar transport system substrate-binding protein